MDVIFRIPKASKIKVSKQNKGELYIRPLKNISLVI